MKPESLPIQEAEDSPELVQAVTPKKLPRHTQVAINNIRKQRESAIAKRDVLNAEIKQLDAAWLALGGPAEA